MPSRRHSRQTGPWTRPMAPPYTRRLLGGRHPSWGIGVTSLMRLTSSPAACSDRIAASRPAPGPLTYTSTWRTPFSMALRAALSAASPAAKGVPLRDPLNPAVPALAQARTLPWGSVMVTIVLLNVDWMWALPSRHPLPPSHDGDGAAFDRRPVPTVLRGPFRVRALVRVRWPRTGRPRRWRRPR